MIYTRRIAAPDVAAKLTGKESGTNIAVLSAIDGQATSLDGLGHPVVNVIRLQRDVAGQSKAGFVYTGRLDDAYANHVVAADTRLVFGKVYYLQLQLGRSRTSKGDTTITAPVWEATFNRNGRLLGMRYKFTGIHPGHRHTWSSFGLLPIGGPLNRLASISVISFSITPGGATTPTWERATCRA